MKKRGLLVLVGMLVLFVIVCCAMTAACADGETSGHNITLAVTKTNVLIKQYFGITVGNVADAKMLELHFLNVGTNEENTYTLSGGPGWSTSTHETWETTESVYDTGNWKIYAVAKFWEENGPGMPSSEMIETVRSNEVTVSATATGTAEAPTVTLSKNSVKRGEALRFSFSLSEIGYGSIAIYKQGTEETGRPLVYDGYYDIKTGEFAEPTYALEPGTYTLKVWHNIYKEGVQDSHTDQSFTVTANESWTDPATIYWDVTTTAVSANDPFEVGFYVPGADYCDLTLVRDGTEEYWARTDCNSGMERIACPFAGEYRLQVTAYTYGANGTDSQVFVCPKIITSTGAEIPDPVITCNDSLIIGNNLSFTVTPGQGEDPTQTYNGLNYHLSIYGEGFYAYYEENITPGEIQIAWDEIYMSSSPAPGNKMILTVSMDGKGYSRKTVQKTVTLKAEQTQGFRLSSTQADQNGNIRLPVDEMLSLSVTKPNGTGTVYVWNPMRSGWDEYYEGMAIFCYESSEDVILTARYKDANNKDHYSNELHLTVYDNGPLPKPEITTNLTGSNTSGWSIERGESLTVTLSNKEAYTDGTEKAWIIFTINDKDDNNADTTSYQVEDITGTISIYTAELDPENGPYTLKAYANDCPGWGMSEESTVCFQVTEPAPYTIKTSASSINVQTSESYDFSIYAPGSTKVELYRDGVEYWINPSGTNAYRFNSSESYNGVIRFTVKAYYDNHEPVTSEPIIVNATAPNGNLARKVSLNVPEYADPDEDLTVTVTWDTQAAPESIYVYLDSQEWYGDAFTPQGNTVSFTIPSSYLEEGEIYSISCTVNQRGWNQARLGKAVFTTKNGTATEGFVISTAGTDSTGHVQVPVCVEQKVTVTAPAGVENIEIYDHYGTWNAYEGSYILHNWEPLNEWSLIARYQDAQGGYHYSNILHVTFISNGQHDEPMVTTDMTSGENGLSIERGDLITLTIENAANYPEGAIASVYYRTPQGETGEFINQVIADLSGGKLSIPTSYMEGGVGQYTLYVSVYGSPGLVSSKFAEIPFRVTEAAAGTIKAYAYPSEVLTGEPFYYGIYAPGAVSIQMDTTNGPYLDEINGEEYNNSSSYSNATSVCFKYKVYYSGQTEPVESTPVTVLIKAPYGRLADVLVPSIGDAVEAGKALTVSLTSDEQVIPDNADFSLYDESGWWVWDSYSSAPNNDGTYTIPATCLQAGKVYRINYSARKKGWESFNGEKTFIALANGSQTEWLTINGKKTDQEIQCGTTIHAEMTPPAGTQRAEIYVPNYGWQTVTPNENGVYTKEFTISSLISNMVIARYSTNGTDWAGFSNLVNITGMCEHEHTNLSYSWNYDTRRYESVDNHDHLVIGKKYRDETCNDCGTLLSREERTKVYTEQEPHSYDSNGVCILCGHQNTCTHSNTKTDENYLYGYSQYNSISPSKHEVTGRGYRCVYCPDCGTQISYEENITLSSEENHRFNANHICDLCGYECKHEGDLLTSTEKPEKTEYVRVDEYFHRKNVLKEEYTESCSNCGMDEFHPQVNSITEEYHTDADQNNVCDVCGFSIPGTWTWEISDGTLYVRGKGAIPDFTSATANPWQGRAEIRQIILEEGISGIGAYAFAGFGKTIRVDFAENMDPTKISANAFAGTTAICRYYTKNTEWESDTWKAAHQYGGTLTWMYLPTNDWNVNAYWLVYNAEDGWTLTADWLEEPVQADREVLEEITYARRNVILKSIPANQADRNVYENHMDIVETMVFQNTCSGTYSMTLPTKLLYCFQMVFDCPNLEVTINSEDGGDPINGVEAVSGKKILINRDINTMTLDYSGKNTADATVNGNIRDLQYYHKSGGANGFKGNLTVNGTIETGYVYGKSTVSITNIGEDLPLSGAINQKFENVSQSTPIILNSEVNMAGIQMLESYSEDECELSYSYSDNNWWELSVKPRSGVDSAAGAWLEQPITEYNPDFMISDICWGEYTSLRLENVGNADEPLVLEGGANGKGLKFLGIFGDANYIAVNCPVDQLSVYGQSYTDEDLRLSINSAVREMELHNLTGKDDMVTLGSGGSVQSGIVYKTMFGNRYFGPVSGSRTLYSEAQIRVLSWKNGEWLRVLLPSDNEVSKAVGNITEQETAIIDTNQNAQLQPGDYADALDKLGAIPDDVEAAFDLYVDRYTIDESGNLNFVEKITELKDPVTISVANPTGKAVAVVRLHEKTDATGKKLVADRLTPYSNDKVLTFASDGFSTYLLMTEPEGIDPAKLTRITLPTGIKRIEEGALEGVAAQAVIVPAGCEYIGDRAFANCPNLVYVSYPAGVTLEGDPFAGSTVKICDVFEVQ